MSALLLPINPIDASLEPAVLAMNNEHARELSWLEPAEFTRLVGQAFFARRIGEVEAFMLGFDHGRAAGHDIVACEVNLDPPNPGSLAFHAALGFEDVGTASIYGGKRTVRYFIRRL